MAEWETIGHVGVDAGCLLIGDPSYVFDGFDYEAEVCSDWQFYREAIDGLAMLVSSGLGDGMYPVEAKIEEVEGWGERVTEVRIRFIPHPVFGPDNE